MRDASLGGDCVAVIDQLVVLLLYYAVCSVRSAPIDVGGEVREASDECADVVKAVIDNSALSPLWLG